MVGISTLYVANLAGAAEMTAAISGLPVEGVEIDYRIKASVLRDLVALLREARIPVLSLHHPVPLPDDATPDAASGDRLSLSSPGREEREAALKAALGSLQLASDLEAAAVVFHLGSVAELEPLWAELRRHFEQEMVDSEEAAGFRAEAVSRRQELAGPYVERAMLALEKLLVPAERLGVRIGLEVRYHFHEVPSPAEIARILDTFRGAAIGYWHDTGHAEVQERVGFLSHRAMLERFASELLGAHLHDVRGLTEHLCPGEGTIDFPTLAPLLAKTPIKILEVLPAPRERALEGLSLLREAGVIGSPGRSG
jgi:sugar phosphate isomerase/epimerase